MQIGQRAAPEQSQRIFALCIFAAPVQRSKLYPEWVVSEGDVS
jgi:hypothetical protein